jgi:hypothetical protein
LVNAGALAASSSHGYIGTEHLLLALAEDPDGLAGQLLDRLGVRTHVINGLASTLGTAAPTEPHANPGDESAVWISPERLANHPITLSEPGA